MKTRRAADRRARQQDRRVRRVVRHDGSTLVPPDTPGAPRRARRSAFCALVSIAVSEQHPAFAVRGGSPPAELDSQRRAVGSSTRVGSCTSAGDDDPVRGAFGECVASREIERAYRYVKGAVQVGICRARG